MSVVIVGGNERMERQYKDLCQQYRCHAKVYTKESGMSGKKVALFGSYGWGDGAWMRSWESKCADKGINLAAESVICNEAPDDDGVAKCNALGAALA